VLSAALVGWFADGTPCWIIGAGGAGSFLAVLLMMHPAVST
jgi:hypothetical protein